DIQFIFPPDYAYPDVPGCGMPEGIMNEFLDHSQHVILCILIQISCVTYKGRGDPDGTWGVHVLAEGFDLSLQAVTLHLYGGKAPGYPAHGIHYLLEVSAHLLRDVTR